MSFKDNDINSLMELLGKVNKKTGHYFNIVVTGEIMKVKEMNSIWFWSRKPKYIAKFLESYLQETDKEKIERLEEENDLMKESLGFQAKEMEDLRAINRDLSENISHEHDHANRLGKTIDERDNEIKQLKDENAQYKLEANQVNRRLLNEIIGGLSYTESALKTSIRMHNKNGTSLIELLKCDMRTLSNTKDEYINRRDNP